MYVQSFFLIDQEVRIHNPFAHKQRLLQKCIAYKIVLQKPVLEKRPPIFLSTFCDDRGTYSYKICMQTFVILYL